MAGQGGQARDAQARAHTLAGPAGAAEGQSSQPAHQMVYSGAVLAL